MNIRIVSRMTKPSMGFSLVELIAAVVIMGLLVSTVAIGVNRQVSKAKVRAAQTQMATFKNAVKLFELECGFYPKSLDELINPPVSDCRGAEGGFLEKKEIPMDPWNQPYNYASPGMHNPDSFDMWSMGPDRQDGTADDITNWASEGFSEEG